MTTERIVPTMCRNCTAYCPILVTVVDGRPVKVAGNPAIPEYGGYTCPKGRRIPEQHNDPRRLLHSVRRAANGCFERIDPLQAVDEIAAKLQDIIARHGPNAVALYFGGGILSQTVGVSMAFSLFGAMGSTMTFSPSTIDKPAEKISLALHGNWQSGAHSFATSDTWMIVGGNPVIAKSNGAPYHNPGMRLKEAVNGGMKLIVVDPRITETAKRAHVHLQARPGEDATILAGIIRIIIAEGLHDPAFVADNAVGFEALTAAVDPYTPDYVAERAGIAVDDLLDAARTFGRGRRGGVVCSTGASFSPHGNLTFYLGLCLNTLCGRWSRAGEVAAMPNVLLPAFTPKAQPQGPYPVFGKHAMRVKGLRQNAAGMPTAALADEMLLEGDGQVKALICVGGNPMSSWPDERKTEAALRNLDLLVQFDVQMSQTARLADYVVATQMALEVPATTYLGEGLKYLGVSRGFEIQWAQYTPAIVDPPAGADLINEHAFIFRLAQKMGLQLNWVNFHGSGPHLESPTEIIPLDMTRIPSIDDLLDLTMQSARIKLDEVKTYPEGHAFDTVAIVEPKDADCTDKLQLADPMMIAELAEMRGEDHRVYQQSEEFAFRLVSRRANGTMNSILVDSPTSAKKRYNPTFMHPADLDDLGLKDGDVVTVRSPRDTVLSIVEADRSLRRGVVAMTHGFGANGREQERDPYAGTNVNLLIPEEGYDSISGIPRMSTIPVAIARAEMASA